LGESAWRAVYQDARTAWPGVELGWGDFWAHVCSADSAELVTEHGGDAFLAWACAAGDTTAIGYLDRRFLQAARPAIGRIDARADFVDEVLQELRTKLLIAPNPRIARYGGRGPLLTWVRVAASRTAIDVLRTMGSGLPAESLETQALGAADLGPEVRLLREMYRQSFQESLAAAFRALEPADRNLLRRHFIDKMTLEEMATPFGVHPATIARKLMSLRELLADEVKDALVQRHPELGASGALESMAHAIRSEVYVSLTPLLSKRD
jgi:RNA polymerase sigma-70 factor (ECF subfamily)